MKLFNEHLYLLMRRESRVVLGRRAVNLWLLVLVLTATFFAIAFSAGSTAFLEEKMNDPFTNWVNIDLNGTGTEEESIDSIIKKLKNVLNDTSTQNGKIPIRNRYGFDGVQTEINSSLNLVATNGSRKLFSTLFYEDLSSDLIAAVLDEENVINSCCIAPDSIICNSIGIIMTLDAIRSLGYDQNSLPAFIDYHSKSVGADTLGINMLYDGNYARAPLPLLAVVKRLPMNKDAVTSKYLNEIRLNIGADCPIDMNHESYARELFFFVPSEVADFEKAKIQDALIDSLRGCIDEVLEQSQVKEKLRPWKTGKIWRVYTIPGVSLSAIISIEQCILDFYADSGVERIYNYEVPDKVNYTTRDNVISVHFIHLDSISSFEHYVKELSGLQIEMTQVNSKKNFWAVSAMANILTAAMIVFSIISIIIFIINMMQSYFQKVKRNLGTFKAFGISTSELTRVYVVIIVGIVVAALVLAMIVVWLTELLLPLKEGEYNSLILWNRKTMWAVIIILASTICSILFVMHRLLRQTPGDLIYDR